MQAPDPLRPRAGAMLLSVVLLAYASSSVASVAMPLPDGAHDFNSPGFVVRYAWVSTAHAATSRLREDMSATKQDATVERFLELNREILNAERSSGVADATSGVLRAERRRIENDVEAIFEDRLSAIIEDAKLTRRVGGDLVWPPVDIEFSDPPAVLVLSPRDEIRREHESLLEGDLPIERIDAIEARAERDGETSALVEQVGGVAMYPAIIPPSADYAYLARLIAHEWMHHYLFFAPLGRRYFAGGDLTTLNETVADIAGNELGAMLVERYPLVGEGDSSAGEPPADVDFVSEMRGLRREVERLLEEGNIEDAERLMDEKRLFLAEHGYYIRRINQAYFAFHGSYAGSAGSIDPIGPKLDELREGSPSLRAFVQTARRLTSEADLDRALGVEAP